jgi:hypothetical protein
MILTRREWSKSYLSSIYLLWELPVGRKSKLLNWLNELDTPISFSKHLVNLEMLISRCGYVVSLNRLRKEKLDLKSMKSAIENRNYFALE